tara:strand:+ start:1920 stop:2483 length:564 start_codon:yes stop_codon:yes gene_type:complete
MKFPETYKCLTQNVFEEGDYKIVPIRFEDRIEIMKWRNEQVYHLRQVEALTEENQEKYFNTVVAKLFEEAEPNQLLFSYLKDGICIGYGGLVHINWVDRNAEISFIINTELENLEFQFHWKVYLSLIEKLAFKKLDLHKLYIYAFDLRPHLYEALRDADYFKDATLRDHCFFDNNFLDIVIHSKINL